MHFVSHQGTFQPIISINVNLTNTSLYRLCLGKMEKRVIHTTYMDALDLIYIYIYHFAKYMNHIECAISL